MKPSLCFATNNAHKIKEISKELHDYYRVVGLEEIGCHEELPETQPTIAGNSRQKAAYVWEHYQANCFADDTGLEISALDGAPGVYSARYAGAQRSSEDNIALVLSNLAGKPDRSALFRTVITLVLDGEFHQFEGVVQGVIRDTKVGAAGFGYDPIFEPNGYNVTFAEMDLAQKNAISHRGIAVRKLIDFLKAKNLHS